MSPNNLDRFGNNKGNADNSAKTLKKLAEKLTEWQMAKKDREHFGIFLDTRTKDWGTLTFSQTLCENTLNPSGQIHYLDFLTGIRITTEQERDPTILFSGHSCPLAKIIAFAGERVTSECINKAISSKCSYLKLHLDTCYSGGMVD